MPSTNGGSGAGHPRPLYVETPLIYSAPLSKQAGHNIFLKLESVQPSGSFKYRGISRTLQAHAQRLNGERGYVISSSGGNAGLAAATAARVLGMECTVFCPTSTEDFIVEQLKAEGAKVVQGGAAWDVCDQDAKEKVQEVEASHPGRSIYLHPFEGEELVAGHASMVQEIYSQLASMPEAGSRLPDLIACSVGGGGLLAGILTGVNAQKLESSDRPHVVAVECFGADSFAQSFNSGKVVTLPAITSAAKSLGALTASSTTLRLAREYAETSPGKFSTLTVPDELAAYNSWHFAKDAKMIVELACSASLSPAYLGVDLLPPLLGVDPTEGQDGSKKNVVLVVCGGSKVTVADLEKWRTQVPDIKTALKSQPCTVNGKQVKSNA